ncbi:2OG-Fe(II) oxygenase [Leptolyngbya sp. 'hensonii']|uniref:2OG-Fe(II) oxygenase n=1 Tax=Leptolyngbya sp. 'hensonii' TaxID=1922337 RepID=UPI00209BA4AE|nr:2OG-Fe(II) oxygenase [Leptolyngbya sp. 'hensonii']
MQLLLLGGYQYTIHLRSDDPLLRKLQDVLMLHSQGQTRGACGIFQIPLEGGIASLCFPGEHLVGIVTEPPFKMKVPGELDASSPLSTTSPLSPEVLISEYWQIDNFLTRDEHKRLLSYVLEQEANFVPTSTSTDEADYRKSVVLYAFPEFEDLIRRRIQAIMPDILRKLKITPFPISQVEAQLTAHNDGNYYREHNDNGSPDTALRELTYVYYFYREPKSFSGGELRIYDSQIDNDMYVPAESYRDVDPRNNSIVFFLSRYSHEVLKVNCPSQQFADSRFTINGWVWR